MHLPLHPLVRVVPVGLLGPQVLSLLGALEDQVSHKALHPPVNMATLEDRKSDSYWLQAFQWEYTVGFLQNWGCRLLHNIKQSSQVNLATCCTKQIHLNEFLSCLWCVQTGTQRLRNGAAAVTDLVSFLSRWALDSCLARETLMREKSKRSSTDNEKFFAVLLRK